VTPERRAGYLAVASGLDPSTALPVPAGDLVELLEGAQGSEAPRPRVVVADLTCREAGAVLGRAASTVRGWCEAGILTGYRMRSREWRIPAGELERFQQDQRTRGSGERRSGARARGKPVDLAAWRKVGGQVA
jgi:hypothetical protein